MAAVSLHAEIPGGTKNINFLLVCIALCLIPVNYKHNCNMQLKKKTQKTRKHTHISDTGSVRMTVRTAVKTRVEFTEHLVFVLKYSPTS